MYLWGIYVYTIILLYYVVRIIHSIFELQLVKFKSVVEITEKSNKLFGLKCPM